MAVEVKQIDGLSFSVTGLENHYDIEKSVYSALSLATLNLNKIGNYSLLIKSDGHHNLLITTDAPQDVIEPIIADLREKTVRAAGRDGDGNPVPEYTGDISGLEKAALTSYTLPGTTGNMRASIRAALWLKDMRTGGKNQQFTGIRAGVDGSGTASALFRSDDAEVSGFMYRTFDNINTRQGAVDAIREQADTAIESTLKQQLPPEAYREYAKYEKWNDDVILRNGKIREIKEAIKTASPKEAARMQRGMERLQRKNSRYRRRLRNARARTEDNLLAYSGDISGLTERIEAISNKKRPASEDKARVLSLLKKRDAASARMRREEDRRKRLASYDPGTPQFQDRLIRQYAAAEAARKVRNQWIKDNPGSQPARNTRRADRKKTAAKLKSGVVRVAGLILGVVGAAVGLLAKLYSAVTDIGKNVARQTLDAMSFNMPYTEMQDLNRFASSRTNLSPDIFSKIFSKVTASFSNPVALDTDAIGKLAPYLGTTTVRLTDFITRKTDRPDTIAYAIINKMMQNTVNGIGGVQSGLDSDEAFAINREALAAFDPHFAELYADWYYWAVGEERSGKTTLRQEARTGIYNSFIEPLTPEGGALGGSDYEAAKESQSDLQSFVAGLRAIKDDILTKMLVYLGDLVVLARNFVMKWFAKNNLFPEYVASESAAAEMSNAEGREVIGKQRDFYEPAVQALADEYGTGGTPEARKKDFFERMEKVKNGNISALPEKMSMAEFYNIYGGAVSYYQALDDKMKEFDSAYDAKTKLTMYVNWSLDRVNSAAGGMAHEALRNTRNTADRMKGRLEPGVIKPGGFKEVLKDLLVRFTVGKVGLQSMVSDVIASIASRDTIAQVLDMDVAEITDANYRALKQRAERRVKADKELLARFSFAITLGDSEHEGLSGFTDEDLSRIDSLLYKGGNWSRMTARSSGVPSTDAEAAPISAGITERTNYRSNYTAAQTAIERWIAADSDRAAKFVSQGWKAYASTESAGDTTITIKLVDPEGKEQVITTDLHKVGSTHFNDVEVHGVLGDDYSAFLENPHPY